MLNYQIIKISEQPRWLHQAANFFHRKWNIPLQSYIQSMEQSLSDIQKVPQWYIAVMENQIIGGLGVIENDFHERKDLHPNICAVYVEKAFRNQQVAGTLLNFACLDMHKAKINTLYLLTDHTSFYERYGWRFLCLVKAEHETQPSRMYIHEWEN